MIFSSPIFLFAFLPIVLIVYHSCGDRAKNSFLLFASLFFYAWGEVFYLAIMLISILINFYFGLRIGKQEDKRRYWLLALGVSLNLALLISYKYANFLVDNLNYVISIIGWQAIDFAPIHLPLGISFFTFQAISYLVDVYRKQVDAQSKLLNLGLYISLFPQLIAGPIVRYAHIAKQINERSHSSALFASGIRRFLIGLSKRF